MKERSRKEEDVEMKKKMERHFRGIIMQINNEKVTKV